MEKEEDTICKNQKLKDFQVQAIEYIRKQSQENDIKCKDLFFQKCQKLGFNKEEVLQTLKYIKESAKLIIHFSLEFVFESLINDKEGTYKNKFEVIKAFGHLDKNQRRDWEKRIFNGIYDNCDSKDRIKYGVLNVFNDPKGVFACRQFGFSHLILKDHVRDRTTICNIDSCFNGVYGTLENVINVLNETDNEQLRGILEVGSGRKQYIDDYKYKIIDGGFYKEIQIHGQVSLYEDVEKVMYDENDWDDDKTGFQDILNQFEKKYNVKCEKIQK